ncbi:MAG: hypothetical protein ACK5IB_07270 [Qingshengfaniella sp.]
MSDQPRPADAPTHPQAATGGLAALLGVVIVLGVAIFTLIGTPLGHSYGFNMAWLVAFDAAASWASPYPRHLPALWDGLGGLDFFFYGPLPFQIAAGPVAALCPGCSPQTLFGLTGGLIWAGSALSFRLFAGRLLPRPAASAAALVWALMPYHLGIDWVVRQAAGEFAAYLFLPLVGHGMLVALQENRTGWSLPLGMAGLTLCHLPTVLLAGHVLGLGMLVWALTHPHRALPVLGRITAMATAGVAAAAIYWLPALILLGDVSPEGLHTPDLSPTAWYLIGPGILPDTLYRLALWSCQMAALAAAGGAVLISRGEMRRQLILWALGPAALVVLLNTSLAAPLWENWIIGQVQFPFRLTVFSDWAAALAAGVLIATLLARTPPAVRTRRLALAGLAALAFSGLIVAAQLPGRVIKGIQAKGDPVAMIGAPEYLPPAVFGPLRARLTAGNKPIWEMPRLVRQLAAAAPEAGFLQPAQTAPRAWHTPPSDHGGPLRIALPYWPHLTAETESGHPVSLTADPDTGLSVIALSPDASSPGPVLIRLPWHWSEWLGALLSGLGMLGMLASGLRGWRRIPRQ